MWRECEERAALEKIKQGLQQKKKPPNEGKKQAPVTKSAPPLAKGNATRQDSSSVPGSTFSVLQPLCPVIPFPASSAVPSSLATISPAMLAAGSGMGPSAIDPRLLLLYQPALFSPSAPFSAPFTPSLGLALTPPDAYVSGRAFPNLLTLNPDLSGEPTAPAMVQQQLKVKDTK